MSKLMGRQLWQGIGPALVLSCLLGWTADPHSVHAQTDKPEMVISPEAMEIHQSGMLFDGHNDLPWTMRMNAASSFDQVDIAQPTEFHTDIPRLRKGGLKAQYWSVFVPAGTDLTGTALVQTLEQIELVHRMCERYPDVFEMASTVADIERIAKEGKIASLIGVEGGHSIQNSLQALRELYDQGARYMTLTHSKTLAWADSATDDAKNNGLSPFGKEVVREMNRLGMLVDLSHVSEKCMRDALETTEAPVIFSHSSARAICDHPRNVSDEILKLTAKNGGVVMVNFMSGYIVPTATLKKNKTARGHFKTVCDHIEHIIDVAGIDHVGIGSDFDGVPSLPIGLDDVSYYPNITQELLNRGYNRQQIHKVLGGNALRVLRDAEKVSARLKQQGRGAKPKQLFSLSVAAGKFDRVGTIAKTLVSAVDPSIKSVTLTDQNGARMIGQLSPPSIAWGETKEGQRELSFVIPSLGAGQTLDLVATTSGLNVNNEFKWHDDASGEAELRFDGRGGDIPVMKYMYASLDESTKETRDQTYKVFHHAYSPDGSQLLTKGPGGLFPHHRGMFYGFNRIRYGDNQSADVWHCKEGASQTHEETVRQIAGPVFGRHVVVIHWRGKDGKPFAYETREMTAYRVNHSNIIDFCSVLTTAGGEVKLDGDPQHAGFQFRATQRVPDETRELTFYVRPDGVGEPGKFRNWSANKNDSETNKNHINLPWNAMCMTLPALEEETNKRRAPTATQFTVAYLDHPDNPKPSRYSERDYGRFGSYFEHTLTGDHPLLLKYRIKINDTFLEKGDIQAASDDFVHPPSKP